MQPNLKKNSLSKNVILSNEYNNLRIHLALLLRNINEINTYEDMHPQEVIVKLKAEKKVFKKMDKNSILYIESLLSKKELSVQNSTSLLNAVGFSHSIAKELINAMIQIQKTYFEEGGEAESSGGIAGNTDEE
ncbi:hypothetical protein [uncultured Helicobacter sp.]|uniref:hypothetical protein n=1 Tax=uncultured Helicobacter sp. TaxID=175537 RepID=UPI0026077864|nr:hypothetical protein [uncultured Helicobacter sp.]